MDETFYVQIIQFEDQQVVKQRGPFAERHAEKVDRGVNINLNHKKYYTLIVNSEEENV
jgi:hypothetical protein